MWTHLHKFYFLLWLFFRFANPNDANILAFVGFIDAYHINEVQRWQNKQHRLLEGRRQKGKKVKEMYSKKHRDCINREKRRWTNKYTHQRSKYIKSVRQKYLAGAEDTTISREERRQMYPGDYESDDTDEEW